MYPSFYPVARMAIDGLLMSQVGAGRSASRREGWIEIQSVPIGPATPAATGGRHEEEIDVFGIRFSTSAVGPRPALLPPPGPGVLVITWRPDARVSTLRTALASRRMFPSATLSMTGPERRQILLEHVGIFRIAPVIGTHVEIGFTYQRIDH